MPAIHPATRLGPVLLAAADLERSLAFYGEVLGLQVRDRRDDLAVLTADGAAPLVVLVALPGARPQPRRTTGLYHFAILLPTRRELARALARLVQARYPLHGASDHLVSEALYLADPDGHGIELYADRPRQQWPTTARGVAMATAPLDLDSLLADLDAPAAAAAGSLPPQTRIGHVHLRVADLGEAEAFYHGRLGFDVTQRDYPGALFLAAGGYHHHIGVNIWGSQGAPPPPRDALGLRAFTIVLPDAAALAAVLRRLDPPPQEGPAGWFVRDPFGIGILVTHEGATVRTDDLRTVATSP
ncbi:MAG: VOC family protein [Armatimonadota bacterium]|nr:VOC family protein [Armatimonadota bacterium]MDR7533815.1 VOC family protein [Armatimonadota bacterium]MDR7536656.1 VOC family protein [Armatimonadota bacterium]